jgi:hypothetical protein
VERRGASLDVKLRALGHAIEVLLWFHERQVRVNDVHVANILCTQDGRAVYFVDCDAMIGPWGQVARPGAPEYMLQLVPEAANPTPATDMARMGWAILCILLDSPGLQRVDPRHLVRVIRSQPDADFLIHATESGRTPAVPVREWRRLAQRWIGGAYITGRAGVGHPTATMGATPTATMGSTPIAAMGSTPVAGTQPFPQVGPTRPIRVQRLRPRAPGDWVPDEDRRPELMARRTQLSPPRIRSPEAAPAASPAMSSLLIITIAVAVLTGLAVLTLVLQGLAS